jgi:hypothetical protein
LEFEDSGAIREEMQRVVLQNLVCANTQHIIVVLGLRFLAEGQKSIGRVKRKHE